MSSLARISLSRSSCSSLASQKPRARRKVSTSAPSTLMRPAFGRWIAYSGTQRPIELAATTGKQILECAAHRPFVVDVELSELAQRLVIFLDQLVRGLQVEWQHGNGPVYNLSAAIQLTKVWKELAG